MRVTPTVDAEIRFAPWTREIRQSTLREIHTLLSRPGLLSFALGMPAAELFPVAGCARAARAVLRGEPDALQYGLPLGRLRAQVVELTYDGMLGSLRPLQPRLLTVPSHLETGIDLDALEALLAAGEAPALVYTIPEGHNPLGSSMPHGARTRLAALARRYGIAVVEDDAYGLLRYDGDAPPALRAYDPGRVLYVGSFSKVMAPGLRVGWVVAPPPVVQRLSVLKQGSDLDVSSFAQRTLSAFLDGAPFGRHLARLRRVYGVRRDAMLAALAAHFPAGARWTRPRSGMFVWVELPGGVDSTELLRRAVEEVGVAFIPGRAFCAEGGLRGGEAVRLNFSRTTPEEIEEGIRRLGGLLGPRRAAVALPEGARTVVAE